MHTGTQNTLTSLRLLQIASPGLPVGAFSYSQGLEYAVEAGWVTDKSSFKQWLHEQLYGTIACQDLPLLERIYRACASGDKDQIENLSVTVLAHRETAELRQEERLRGRAMLQIVRSLSNERCLTSNLPHDSVSQLAVFADYCCFENIALESALETYCYMWIESQVTAGIKLIPLGQTDGQQLIYSLSDDIAEVTEVALQVSDDDIGYSSPAIAMASAFHETQYSRLFRS